MHASGVTDQTEDVAVLPEAGAPGTFLLYCFVSLQLQERLHLMCHA